MEDKLSEYTDPGALVSTVWVADHLDDPAIRLVESDEDVLRYAMGHIPGAVRIDWHVDLNDPLIRDYIDREHFQELMRQRGIDNDTTVILYGDKSNWWAAYAFWVFQLFGHAKVRLMDGGRAKWIAEGRELTRDAPAYPRTNYMAPERNDAPLRIFRDDVLIHFSQGGALIDVRSPAEYRGEMLHMADYPQEGALRGGHIPGAESIPWVRAVNSDGTFKSAQELRSLYQETYGLNPDDDIVVYCRIGERSSHTWFVLTHLLGYKHVRNYDGSWTEWGNGVRLPIER